MANPRVLLGLYKHLFTYVKVIFKYWIKITKFSLRVLLNSLFLGGFLEWWVYFWFFIIESDYLVVNLYLCGCSLVGEPSFGVFLVVSLYPSSSCYLTWFFCYLLVSSLIFLKCLLIKSVLGVWVDCAKC